MNKNVKRLALMLACVLLLACLPLSAGAANSNGSTQGSSSGLKISAQKELFLDIGAAAPLTVKVPGEDPATLTLVYKSGNELVATVDETGLVTGVGHGSTIVSVAYGKQTLKVPVYVCEGQLPYTRDPEFTMNVPASWLLFDNYKLSTPDFELKATFVAPSRGGELYTDNIIVYLEWLPPDATISLDAIAKAITYGAQKANKTFKAQSVKKITMGGLAGRTIQATMSLGSIKLKVQYFYTVQDNIVYMILYTGESQDYDLYIGDILRMVDSFRLLV